MKSNPDVSFVVHGLNEEKVLSVTLKRLREIKNEATKDVEIIFIDEGSEDGSVKVARRFADRVYQLKGKPVFGRTRDFGSRQAKGKIIVSIDSENLLPLDAVDKIMKAFSDRKVVAMTCECYVFPWEENYMDRVFHVLQNEWFYLLCVSGILPMGKELHAFRRDAFEKVQGYNDKLAASEDVDLFRRIARVGKVVFMKELKIYESPARYRKFGYLRTYAYWTLNSLKYLLGMPVEEYKRVVH